MKEKMEFKKGLFEVKKEGDNLYIEGYAAKYGNIDSHNDIILQGALSDFLNTPDAQRVKFCFMHEFDKVIGVIEELKEDAQGIFFRAKVSNTSDGKDAAILIEDGALKEFSIGYYAEVYTIDNDTNTRMISKLYLFEISLVSRGSNDQATLTGAERKDEKTPLTDEQLQAKVAELKAELKDVENEQFNRLFNKIFKN